MKKIILITLIGLLQSCSNGFKHEIGDVTTYKLYSNRVLILDTLTKYGKPYYKIQAQPDCKTCKEASELELN
jgi:hypothetical protein